MRINKWFGKLNIRFEIRWKRHYKHSYEYLMKKMVKASMIYGNGFMKVEWVKPWQFWKRGWENPFKRNPTNKE